MRRRLLGSAGVCSSRSQDVDDAVSSDPLGPGCAGARDSIGRRDAVGAWLFRVAYRIAHRIREDAARQRTVEPQHGDVPAVDSRDDAVWREWRPVLDEEIGPTAGQAPAGLCSLLPSAAGLTRRQRKELGCPVGYGAVPHEPSAGAACGSGSLAGGWRTAVGAFGNVASGAAWSAVPAVALANATLKTARLVADWADGGGWRGCAPAGYPWQKGVLKAMWLTKVKMAAAAMVIAFGVLGTGTGLVVHWAPGKDPTAAELLVAVPAHKKGNVAAAGGKEIADLAEARLQAARAVYDTMMKQVRAGRGRSRHGCSNGSPNLLEAELDAAKDQGRAGSRPGSSLGSHEGIREIH